MTLELQQELERLRAENELLKRQAKGATKAGELSLKVSEKGAISVYGVNKMPVTLYYPQWVKVIAIGENLKAFYEANKEDIDRISGETKLKKQQAAPAAPETIAK